MIILEKIIPSLMFISLLCALCLSMFFMTTVVLPFQEESFEKNTPAIQYMELVPEGLRVEFKGEWRPTHVTIHKAGLADSCWTDWCGNEVIFEKGGGIWGNEFEPIYVNNSTIIIPLTSSQINQLSPCFGLDISHFRIGGYGEYWHITVTEHGLIWEIQGSVMG